MTVFNGLCKEFAWKKLCICKIFSALPVNLNDWMANNEY